MSPTDIALLRLQNQQIAVQTHKMAKEIVSHMGIVQSQDYSMSKWGVGLRLKGATDKSVENALNNAEIIRTHVLRPTWHLVSPGTIYWMLDLSANRIKALMKTRLKELELSEAILVKTNTLLEKILRNGKQLTRDEIAAAMLNTLKLTNDNNRLSHILMYAELDQLICSGALKNGKQTFALLADRVPRVNRLEKETALATLAKIYFTSHGPATVTDFAWWSGLPRTEARAGLESIKKELHSERVGEQEYWLANKKIKKSDPDAIYLLPAFDEFIIGYKDRSASLLAEHQNRVLTTNGIFRPVLVMGGKVTGLWKRVEEKNMMTIAPEFFIRPGKEDVEQVKKRAKIYGKFYNKKSE